MGMRPDESGWRLVALARLSLNAGLQEVLSLMETIVFEQVAAVWDVVGVGLGDLVDVVVVVVVVVSVSVDINVVVVVVGVFHGERVRYVSRFANMCAHQSLSLVRCSHTEGSLEHARTHKCNAFCFFSFFFAPLPNPNTARPSKCTFLPKRPTNCRQQTRRANARHSYLDTHFSLCCGNKPAFY